MKVPAKLVKYKDGYILVSNETPVKGDYVYTREKGKQMIGKVITVRSVNAFKVAVGDLVYSCFNCTKVVAQPEQIGYVEVADSEFEDFSEQNAVSILKKGGNCFVEWSHIAVPTMNAKIDKAFLLNGKVLIYLKSN
jgi:hypothetical protein